MGASVANETDKKRIRGQTLTLDKMTENNDKGNKRGMDG